MIHDKLWYIILRYSPFILDLSTGNNAPGSAIRRLDAARDTTITTSGKKKTVPFAARPAAVFSSGGDSRGNVNSTSHMAPSPRLAGMERMEVMQENSDGEDDDDVYDDDDDDSDDDGMEPPRSNLNSNGLSSLSEAASVIANMHDQAGKGCKGP